MVTIVEEREQAFQRYLEMNKPYCEKVRQAGGATWHGDDTAARRELWMRRFEKPQPPEGMPTIKHIPKQSEPASLTTPTHKY